MLYEIPWFDGFDELIHPLRIHVELGTWYFHCSGSQRIHSVMQAKGEGKPGFPVFVFANTKEVCCAGDEIFILQRKSYVFLLTFSVV